MNCLISAMKRRCAIFPKTIVTKTGTWQVPHLRFASRVRLQLPRECVGLRQDLIRTST